uniref:Uncharacterized protein n=1 Tax=Rhodosorus marinus TaxID=101924 RepID=A0A7S2ZB34_9RHOD|mmetsp:Transcript_12368/g.50751  ORF Transcript_12368/g.50751 Transcript_12368/m.50751 type:complete len:226 (+) Transcript_12368:107-784(+)
MASDAIEWATGEDVEGARAALSEKRDTLIEEKKKLEDSIKEVVALKKSWDAQWKEIKSFDDAASKAIKEQRTPLYEEVLQSFATLKEDKEDAASKKALISIETVSTYLKECEKSTTIAFSLLDDTWKEFNRASVKMKNIENVNDEKKKMEMEMSYGMQAQTLREETKRLEAKLTKLIDVAPFVSEISALCAARVIVRNTKAMQNGTESMGEIVAQHGEGAAALDI